MSSRAFQSLKREVRRLRKELLPDPFNPLGVYPVEVRTRTRAYLLLSHAAFETYFEGEARLIAERAEVIFTSTGKFTRPLTFLIARADCSNLGKKTLEQSIVALVDKIFRTYFDDVRDNNGIKELSIFKLFDPLGVPGTIYDPMLLSLLNSFGADRGTHAHQSGAAIHNVIDPETEFDRVQLLVDEVEKFDEKVRAYYKAIK